MYVRVFCLQRVDTCQLIYVDCAILGYDKNVGADDF